MPTAEEILAQTKKITDENKTLKAENEKLDSRIKSLEATPNLSGVRRDSDGRVTGEWSDTDESITIVSGRDDLSGPRAGRQMKARAAMRSLIRQGYQPWGEFKSLSDFVRSGFDGHQGSAF